MTSERNDRTRKSVKDMSDGPEFEISEASADLCFSEQIPPLKAKSLLAKKIKNGRFYYLVTWEGEDEATWVRDEVLTCDELIKGYHVETRSAKPKPSSVDFLDMVDRNGKIYYDISLDDVKKTISSVEARINWPVELLKFLEQSFLRKSANADASESSVTSQI
jgi:hypothetical protein